MTNYYIDTTILTNTASTDAFDLTGNDDTLFLASTGSLVALGGSSYGLSMTGMYQYALLDGTVYSADNYGVYQNSGGASWIVVNGEVDSAGDTAIYAVTNEDIINVNGSVTGGLDGIDAAGTGDSLHINGSVVGNYGNGVDIGSSTLVIGGKGDVFGVVYGVYADGNSADIQNSGHLSGGSFGFAVYAATGVSLTNDGSVTGVEIIDDSSTSIDNSGLISLLSGPVAIGLQNSTDVFIENSGTVHGNLTVDTASSVTVQNFGNWHGQFEIESSSNSVFNTGTISNGILFGTFSNSTTGNSVVNDGTIHGGIAFNTVGGTPGGDTLINSGTIYGAVHMSTNETLTNTGTIHGNVYFTSGTTIDSGDTFDNSNGIVLGTVNGGGGTDTFIIGLGSNTYNPGGGTDHFDFGAGFGNDIIDNFKTGTGHDYISFSGGDFSSFTELQTHMTQVGGNTIITLESGSTIELHALTMTHLSSADFIFG